MLCFRLRWLSSWLPLPPPLPKGRFSPCWVPRTPPPPPQGLSGEAMPSLLQQWIWDDIISQRATASKKNRPFITDGLSFWSWHSWAVASMASGLALFICAIGFVHQSDVFCEAPLYAVRSAEVNPSPSKTLPQRESKITFFDGEL